MAGWGYQWRKKGPKLRSVGESALQKSANQSGDATEVETLVARFKGR